MEFIAIEDANGILGDILDSLCGAQSDSIHLALIKRHFSLLFFTFPSTLRAICSALEWS